MSTKQWHRRSSCEDRENRVETVFRPLQSPTGMSCYSTELWIQHHRILLCRKIGTQVVVSEITWSESTWPFTCLGYWAPCKRLISTGVTESVICQSLKLHRRRGYRVWRKQRTILKKVDATRSYWVGEKNGIVRGITKAWIIDRSENIEDNDNSRDHWRNSGSGNCADMPTDFESGARVWDSAHTGKLMKRRSRTGYEERKHKSGEAGKGGGRDRIIRFDDIQMNPKLGMERLKHWVFLFWMRTLSISITLSAQLPKPVYYKAPRSCYVTFPCCTLFHHNLVYTADYGFILRSWTGWSGKFRACF